MNQTKEFSPPPGDFYLLQQPIFCKRKFKGVFQVRDARYYSWAVSNQEYHVARSIIFFLTHFCLTVADTEGLVFAGGHCQSDGLTTG